MNAPRMSVRFLARVAVLLTRLPVCVIRVLRWRDRRRRGDQIAVLAIESGPRGWELLEYIELGNSAADYLGEQNVRRLTVTRDDYLRQVRAALRANGITHYFYDPRTGSQNRWAAIAQAVELACLCAWADVTPIARIPDFAHRRWRLQCAIVTAARGAATCVLDPDRVRRYFPHARLIGPMLMPVSEARAAQLAADRAARPARRPPNAIFTGSLYEPRESFLRDLRSGLLSRGHEFQIHGRALGTVRDSNDAYWGRLIDADVVVTTADQMSGPGLDSMDELHLVYRYTEALVAGACLVAPRVPGSENYLHPGTHYVSYTSLAEAVDALTLLLEDDALRTQIARQGVDRMTALIASHAYWKAVDSGLDAHRLRRVSE